MKKWSKSSNEGAVTEIIGTMLLLVIAVTLFSVVYFAVLSQPVTPATPSANIVCRVSGATFILEHSGGSPLSLDSKIIISIGDSFSEEIKVGDVLSDTYKADDQWSLGERIIYNIENFEEFLGNTSELTVVDVTTNSIVLRGRFDPPSFLEDFTLTVGSTIGGEVKDPGEGTFIYEIGTEVNLKAEVDSGYQFVGWEGGNVEDINNLETSIKMFDNYIITAKFAINEYDLTISSTEGGTVNDPGEGVFGYDHGESVNIIATPNTGYHFVEWSGDTDAIDNTNDPSTTIDIFADYDISAEFAINEYDLNISSASGGSVTTPGENTYTHDYGTVVNLVAEPEIGHHFVNWTGDTEKIADINSDTTTITIENDYTISANFTADEHTLIVDSSSGGSVTEPGQGSFINGYGSVVDIVAVADIGYDFVNWTGDTENIDDVNSATTTITIEDDYSIEANFEIKEHDLTISSTTGGSVTTPGENTYTHDYGTVVNLNAEADTGYFFVKWTGNTENIDDANSATTTITIENNYDITAMFAVPPGAPTDFTANTGDLYEIDLSWTIGIDATHTYIRYRQGSSPPSTRTSGTFLYNGTGTSTSATGLSSDTTYSFSAWSYNSISGSWSITYSSDSAKTDDGGGCAFIYSWDGERYHPEHAISDFAVHKFIEYPTYGLLPNLRNINGTYKFAVWEQVPETQYLDTLELWEVIHPIGTEIVPEQTTGVIHTISSKQYPDIAIGTDGNSYTDELSKPDEKYWITNLSTVNLDNPRMWDTLDVIFYSTPQEKSLAEVYNILGIPLPTREVKLVVRGKDTGLLTEAWSSMVTAIEPDYTQYEILNTNMSIFENVSKWAMTTGQLHLYKNGENIHSFMFGNPEFYHNWAISFDYTMGEDIKLQFVGGPYGHQIDEIYIDKKPNKEIQIIKLPAKIIDHNLDSTNQDIEELLSKRDYNYLLMEQGDYMICEFYSNTTTDTMSITPIAFADAYAESYSAGRIITEQNLSLAQEIWENQGLDRKLFIRPFVETIQPILSIGLEPRWSIP